MSDRPPLETADLIVIEIEFVFGLGEKRIASYSGALFQQTSSLIQQELSPSRSGNEAQGKNEVSERDVDLHPVTSSTLSQESYVIQYEQDQDNPEQEGPGSANSRQIQESDMANPGQIRIGTPDAEHRQENEENIDISIPCRQLEETQVTNAIMDMADQDITSQEKQGVEETGNVERLMSMVENPDSGFVSTAKQEIKTIKRHSIPSVDCLSQIQGLCDDSGIAF